jgi:hypothetical protein
MKTHFKILILLLFTQISKASNLPNSFSIKSKTISKEFSVNFDAKMTVKNSYGNVTVVLWDENKISYEVQITAKAKNDKKTDELLNGIKVDFEANSKATSAITTIPSMSGDKTLKINYTIKIPRQAHVHVEQKYGNIYIPELNGTLKLINKYGNIDIGSLHNKQNDFELAYTGNATANYINYGNFTTSYSNIKFEKINYFVAKGNYNNINISNVGTLHAENNYTSFAINNIQKIEVKGNYLNIKINEVHVSSIIKSNYTTVKQNITSQTEFIQYDGNYSTLVIGNIKNQNFNFDVSGSYFTLNSKIDLNYNSKISNTTFKQYTGIANNNAKLKINVKSDYGTLTFNN